MLGFNEVGGKDGVALLQMTVFQPIGQANPVMERYNHGGIMEAIAKCNLKPLKTGGCERLSDFGPINT